MDATHTRCEAIQWSVLKDGGDDHSRKCARTCSSRIYCGSEATPLPQTLASHWLQKWLPYWPRKNPPCLEGRRDERTMNARVSSHHSNAIVAANFHDVSYCMLYFMHWRFDMGAAAQFLASPITVSPTSCPMICLHT